MSKNVKLLFFALHALTAIVTGIRVYAVYQYALIQKGLPGTDVWQGIMGFLLWPMLGLWGSLILLSVFAIVRNLLLPKEGLFHLALSVLAFPLFFLLASALVATIG